MPGFWANRPGLGLATGLAALAVIALVALASGAYPLGPRQLPGVIAALWRGEAAGPEGLVLLNIRLPRIVTAVLVGAVLAGAGSAYQMAFRNPLVSPDILGVSAGAGLGAVARGREGQGRRGDAGRAGRRADAQGKDRLR